MQQAYVYLFLIAAAILEVAGDAVIRRGMRGAGIAAVILGMSMLAAYGVVVNLVPWDFSRLLGVYVAVFATTAVLFGHFFFREEVPDWNSLSTANGRRNCFRKIR